MMIANARRTRYQIADPNIGLELVRATEAAAMAAARWAGRGERHAGDQAAVDAMREVLNAISMRGVVVIGEGDRDEAPMLSNGEALGTGGGVGYDIAVDPVDGSDLLVDGRNNAIAVIAASDRGTMLNLEGVDYMNKLAVGPEAADRVSLDDPVAETIAKVAAAKGMRVPDVTVAILQRPRHRQLVDEVRAAGARISFLTQGDIAAAMACARPDTGLDLLLGIGGAAEGVIVAAAMKTLGGQILTRLAPQSEAERARVEAAGHDLTTIHSRDDLVAGDNSFFVATGITNSWMLSGVRYGAHEIETHSVVMRSRSGTVRHLLSRHRPDRVAEADPLAVP